MSELICPWNINFDERVNLPLAIISKEIDQDIFKPNLRQRRRKRNVLTLYPSTITADEIYCNDVIYLILVKSYTCSH